MPRGIWSTSYKQAVCRHKHCTKQPSYGVDGSNNNAEFCTQDGMIDTHSRKERYEYQECIKEPSHGAREQKRPIFAPRMEISPGGRG